MANLSRRTAIGTIAASAALVGCSGDDEATTPDATGSTSEQAAASPSAAPSEEPSPEPSPSPSPSPEPVKPPFPGQRMIALYGHPSGGTLGMLGEQPPAEAVTRLQDLVAEYQAIVDEPVTGCFEIITTVASAHKGADGDYSYETPIEELMPLIEAAEGADIHCVLDLQPGYTDFLTQAKRYEELLKRPSVSLALDPEWRLEPPQRHMKVIGQVGIDEVNATGAWLADLVKANDLPPKILILHQFQTRMIKDRERLDTSREEIQYLMHADGHGNHGQKLGTWNELRKDLPEGVALGWKNFEDEDSPMMTPAETMAIEPRPDFVSYQ